ncbi:MAG: hypothetical protein WBV65_05930, partial [Xanthobacteraceae bacterium]
LTVQLDQVEGAEHGVFSVACPADEIEHRQTFVVGDDRLAVDHERAARQCRHRRSGEREPRREIMSVASEEPDATASRRAMIRKPSCLIS